jgi:hypothetical protein
MSFTTPWGGDDGDFWILLDLGLALVLGFAAIGLAAMRSRLSRGFGIATMAAGLGLVPVTALVLGGALPSGTAIDPQVREFAAAQAERLSTPQSREFMRAYEAKERRERLVSACVVALAPVAMGAFALFMAAAIARSKPEVGAG